MAINRKANENKILEVERKMKDLSLRISDEQFKSDPITRNTKILNELQEKRREIDVLLEKKNQCQMECDEILERLKKSKKDEASLNLIKAQFDEATNNMQKVLQEMKLLMKESGALKDALNELEKDDYQEYRDLYLKKFYLEREIGVENNEAASNILSLKRKANYGQSSLMEIFVNIFKNESNIIDRFCKMHGFDLASKHLDGITKIEFKSTRPGENFSLVISDDDIGATEPITEDNMRRIIPAMIALFLQGIKQDDSGGCEFTPRCEAAQKYFEDLFSRELVKLGGRFEDFRINGKPASEVALQAKPAAKVVEDVSSETPTMRNR